LTIGFIFLVIVAGALLANRIYNLEPASLSESVVKPHNITYKLLKTLGGNGSFGILLAYNYKNYVRRFENLSKLIYAVVLMIAMLVLLNNVGVDAEFSYMFGQILTALLGGFVVCEATIQGKEKLLIYRNGPLSDWKFMLSKVMLYILIIVPITTFFIAFMTFIAPDFTLQIIVSNVFIVVLLSLAMIILSLGLFLLNPPFNEKAPEFMINFQVLIMVAIFSFIGILILIRGFSFFEKQILHVIFVFTIGTIFLLLGKRKLASLE
jgi:hypothetical protein